MKSMQIKLAQFTSTSLTHIIIGSIVYKVVSIFKILTYKGFPRWSFLTIQCTRRTPLLNLQ